MRGSEHFGVAVFTTGVALMAAGHGRVDLAGPAVAAIAVAGVGSLIPDIDHRGAWISNRIPATLIAFGLTFLGWFGFSNWYVASGRATDLGAAVWRPLLQATRPYLGWAGVALGVGIVLLSVGMFVSAILEHRGPTHSLAACAALTLVACIGFAVARVPWTLGLWFGWGYLSHLLADLLTPMGCPALLWPFGDSLAAPKPGAVPMSVVPAGAPSTTSLGGNPPVVAPVAGTAVAAISHPVCPRCGAALVLRQARRGTRAGHNFYGCSSYPKCRFTQDLASHI